MYGLTVLHNISRPSQLPSLDPTGEPSSSGQDRILQLAEFSFESTSISGFWIAQDASIYRVNSAACQFLGYSKQELESLHIFDIDPSASSQTWSNHWRKLRQQRSMNFTSRHRTKNGRLLPVEIHLNFLQLGEEEFNIAFAHDLTAQRKTEADLRESQQRYSLVIQATNDGIWDWNLDTDEIYFSSRWQEMLGFANGELGSRPYSWFHRIHPQDWDTFRTKLERYLAGDEGQLEHEYRMRHKDGRYLWVLCRGMVLRDYNDRIYRIAGSQTDITKRHNAQQQLIHDALHDPLTGLPNRNFLLGSLDAAIGRHQKDPTALFAVLFLDLDRFKVINDSLGHSMGDRLLIEVANRLKTCVGLEDTVARLGGDEFVILLNVRSEEEANQAVYKVHRTLTAPLQLGKQLVYPAASIGISMSEIDRISSEDYLRRADIAMYQAKSSNQSNVALFTQDMHARVSEQLQLEVELQQAIARNELFLHYQPIVCLATGMVVGVEALLRWTHTQRGGIPPNVFIPIAEETGAIVTIGHWVLQQACRQMHRWSALSPSLDSLFVTVNLSTQQLAQPDFVDSVRSTLHRENLQPERLKLEITESSIAHNTEVARERLSALKQSNISLCMDDFGTGYSSFSYLHQLPIDCIKIDQSFVNRLESQQNTKDIIRAILGIAKSLCLEVVAEGIETDAQLALLREIGCDRGQGYFLSKPHAAGSITDFLLQHCRGGDRG